MLFVTLALATVFGLPQNPTLHLEAEDAQTVGTKTATERAGYSGSGYVTGFEHNGDKVVFKVRAKAGIYEANIRSPACTICTT